MIARYLILLTVIPFGINCQQPAATSTANGTDTRQADAATDTPAPAVAATQSESTPVAETTEPAVAPRIEVVAAADVPTEPECDEEGLEVHRERLANGQQVEYQYKLGPNGERVLHGKWKKWHRNGQSYLDGQYLDGKKTGLWLTWFDNGQQRGKGNFQDDQRHGTWTRWDQSGKETSNEEYNMGEKVGG
jgi:hypothetical protein